MTLSAGISVSVLYAALVTTGAVLRHERPLSDEATRMPAVQADSLSAHLVSKGCPNS